MIGLEITIAEPRDAQDSSPYFIEGRFAEIKIDKKSIGLIGEVHPKILKNWKIRMPVALFEINLEEIFKKLS